jgi:hypothetical protein
MKTRTTIHWLAGLAGALLLAVPVLLGAGRPTDPPPVDPPSQGDESQCEFLLEETQLELEETLDELAECQASNVVFPGDGWPEDDPVVPGGAPLSYAGPGEIGEDDPPDGTFIDLNTGLMWEMKLAQDDPLCLADEQVDRDVHCVQNRYTWTADDDPYPPTGTAFTEFLAELNAGDGFADETDWRLPTVKELQSLVDYSRPNPEEPDVPAVSDELPGATASYYYWSSTANAYFVGSAWLVGFVSGYVLYSGKVNDSHVRAVRGGR